MSSIDCIQGLPANRLVNLYLMSSYLYYIRNQTPIDDLLYDEVCKQLIFKYEDIHHQHGHLITKDALHAGTAYHLKESDYPLMVQSAASLWAAKGSHIVCGVHRRIRRNQKQVADTQPISESKARRIRRVR